MSQEFNETFRRLLDWPSGQGPAERLAAQILAASKYTDIKPSHPLGGKDGGRDAEATRDGRTWAMAVTFPRGQQTFGAIRKKFLDDVGNARSAGYDAVAFVTNQELRLAERAELESDAGVSLDLFDLERLTHILDQPAMHAVREQFLGIKSSASVPEASWHDLTKAAPQTPGAPDHWSRYPGVALMRVLALPAPPGRHPDASSPAERLESAAGQANSIGAAWPSYVRDLERQLRDDWTARVPHVSSVGWMGRELERRVQKPYAAIALDTRTGALAVERTWPTFVGEDGERLNYPAAREPHVLAELLTALRLAGGLLEPYGTPIDVAFYFGATTETGFRVSNERVGGRLFGEPVARIQDPRAEVPEYHLEVARFDLGQLTDPRLAADVLAGPWLATFGRADLLAQLVAGRAA